MCVISRAWSRATTPAEDHLIVLTARSDSTYRDSRMNRFFFGQATGRVISGQTVRGAKHPQLTVQRARRHHWAIEHLDWDLVNWSRCLLIDESRFRLHAADGRKFVWRERRQ